MQLSPQTVISFSQATISAIQFVLDITTVQTLACLHWVILGQSLSQPSLLGRIGKNKKGQKIKGYL